MSQQAAESQAKGRTPKESPGKINYEIQMQQDVTNGVHSVHSGQLHTPRLQKRSPQQHSFHRPENFSYKEIPVFGKQKKKTGMAELLSTARAQPVIVRCSQSPGRTKEAEEAIRMSTYPDGEPPKPGAQAPIEREDFPAPPAPAVFLPEMLRRSLRKKGQPSFPGGGQAFDGNGYNDDDDEEDSDISPKLKREIQVASQLHSPMVQEILTELAVVPEKKSVDPRDSSRAPSAKGKLTVPTRFSSPINASPSRSTDRPRMPSESAIHHRKALCSANTSTAPMSSPLLDRPAYTVYASGTRSATLPPPGTPGAFVYDTFTDDDDEDNSHEYAIVASVRAAKAANGRSSPSASSSLEKKMHLACSTGDADSVFERDSLHRWSSRSDCCGYADNVNSSQFERSSLLRCSTMSDSVAALRDIVQPKTPRKSTASVSDGYPFLNAATLDFRKRSECALQQWEELLFEPEQPYPYEEVKLKSDRRRKGLDETKLEKYLSTADFESVLGMTRDEFYRQPEFKRNDLKRRALLF